MLVPPLLPRYPSPGNACVHVRPPAHKLTRCLRVLHLPSPPHLLSRTQTHIPALPLPTHVSVTHVLQPLLASSMPAQHNKSGWGMMGDFFIDAVHLRKERYGTRLLSDLMAHYFWSAGQALDRAQQQQQQQAGGLPTPTPTPSSLPPYHLPEHVLFPGALRQYKYRCYGVNMSQYMQQEVMSKSSWSADQNMLLELQPGDDFSGPGSGARVSEAKIMSLPPLNVTRLDGFRMQVGGGEGCCR